jgi:hypothetical protein
MANLLKLLFILSIVGLLSCKKDDSVRSLDNERYPLSAIVDNQLFIGNDITQKVENNLGWVMETYDGDNFITIGTSWPVEPGTYTLGTWDPFTNKRFFASYTFLSKEYRTLDQSGTLTIQAVRIENNVIVELIGSFEFTGYSAAGEEILVQSGKLNYQK